jgi:hypothetical protein
MERTNRRSSLGGAEIKLRDYSKFGDVSSEMVAGAAICKAPAFGRSPEAPLGPRSSLQD